MSKSKKKSISKEGTHLKTLLIAISVICVLVIVVELIFLVYKKYELEQSHTYYDNYNSVAKASDGYVAVGSSDFKKSKYNSYTKGYEKGKLVSYDNNYKVLMELKYEKGYNSTFFSVLPVDNGYLVVGSASYDEAQEKDKLRDALILLYDEHGKIVWEKNYQVLGNSKFLKAIEVSDGYVIVGQSIYPPMDLGNHTTGGGVIVKYDKDGNEVWHNNYGGNKSGIFSDIVMVEDGFIVIGKDSVNTGIIVKYSFTGEKLWNRNYSYTDNLGFSSLAVVEDGLIVVGSKKMSEDGAEVVDNDALLVKYSFDGKVLFEKTYKGSGLERYNGVYVADNEIVVIGHTGVKDNEESTLTENVFHYNGLVAKYSLSGEEIFVREYGGSLDEYFNSFVIDDDSYVIVGSSNSKDQHMRGNGKDFFGRIFDINLDGVLKKVN